MPLFSREKKEPPHNKNVHGISFTTASGVCEGCNQRYTGVPVILGKPQCPNCDKP